MVCEIFSWKNLNLDTPWQNWIFLLFFNVQNSVWFFWSCPYNAFGIGWKNERHNEISKYNAVWEKPNGECEWDRLWSVKWMRWKWVTKWMSWTLVHEINEIKWLGKYVTHYKTPRGTSRIPAIEFIVILVNSWKPITNVTKPLS